MFAVLLPLWNYCISSGLMHIGGDNNGINPLASQYSFPEVWGNVGYWGSYFIWFISMLVIILVTNEFTFRTNRQNVIDGQTRLQYFHSKMLLAVVLAVVCTVYLYITGILFGLGNSGSFGDAFSHLSGVLYFFVLSINYLGFAMLLGFLVKKSGLAIGLFMLYTFIIENILKSVINHYSGTPWGNLLPLQASDELLPLPLTNMAKTMLGMEQHISNTTYILVSLGWCVAYYLTGRRLMQKTDW